MKKLIVMFSILGGFVCGIAQGTEKNIPNQEKKCKFKELENKKKFSLKSGGRVERLKVELNLTDAQIEKIKTLDDKEKQARETLREHHKIQMEIRKKDYQNAMKSILTPEQYEKWENTMKQRKKER